MAEVSGAVSAFYNGLKSHGLVEQVLLAKYSEFGRRLKENGSLGTDDGAASQMFVVSGAAKGGVTGGGRNLHRSTPPALTRGGMRALCSVRILSSAIFLLTLASLPAQTPKPAPTIPLTQRAEYRQAIEALADKLPEVAILRLDKLLASGTLKGPAIPAVKLLLAEACVRADRSAEALTALNDSGRSDEVTYWRGAALAQQERYTEAEKTLAALPEGAPFATEAAFTRASILTALGQPSGALALLKTLVNSKDATTAARARLRSAELLITAQRPPAEIIPLIPAPAEAAKSRFAPGWRYLRARLSLLSGDAREAADQFAAMAEGGKGITPSLRQAASLGRARALTALDQKSEARGAVQKFIGLTPPPSASLLLSAFDLFERLNTPPTEEAANFIKEWSKSEDGNLRLLAKLAGIGAMDAGGKSDEALAACKALAKDEAASPLLSWVMLRQARLSLTTGDKAAAAEVTAALDKVSASPAVRAWAAEIKGRAAFEDAKFKVAAREFLIAAQDSTTAEARIAAAYNAAVAELQSGLVDPTVPTAVLEGIYTESGHRARAEYYLERALYLADAGLPGAEEGLQAYVDAPPEGNSRKFEALVALADLALRSPQPNQGLVTARVEAAAKAATDPAGQEAVAWLRVLAAEEGPSEAYTKEAEAFLAAWPETARRIPLRMRMGELNFRRQNFAAARAQFELAAKEAPVTDRDVVEVALFWAGKSALLTLGPASGDDAIALWERVYNEGSKFRLEARLQVAQLKQRRNDFAGALQLINEILSSQPDAGIRRQALCTRGEILTSQNASPEAITGGLAAFDEVSSDAQMAASWRQEALVRKGVCLEQLKRPEEALAAYHLVLTEPPSADNADDYWFHRAGEKALRMMESRGKFEEAIIIAEKMAKAPGARGVAAAELVNTMVLKYGIWREEAPVVEKRPPAPLPK